MKIERRNHWPWSIQFCFRFRILFFSLLFIYTKYIVYLIVKAFIELRSVQFIQTRLRFVAGFMVIIIILCVSIVYSKFGFGVLEDNFVSRMYTSYDSATQFISFYALLNLYLYIMVYVYTPCAGREVKLLEISAWNSLKIYNIVHEKTWQFHWDR